MGEFDYSEEWNKVKDKIIKLSDELDDTPLPYLWITGIENDGEGTQFSILGHTPGEDTPAAIAFFMMLLDNPSVLNFIMENFAVIMAALKLGNAAADKMGLPSMDSISNKTGLAGETNVEDVPDEFASFLDKLAKKNNNKDEKK